MYSFLRYSQFNLPNCLGQDVDPGIWPYHLFRVDCLVSIYGRSWVGKLLVGQDNRQNRETIIDIRKNRNPDWDISRISFYTQYALRTLQPWNCSGLLRGRLRKRFLIIKWLLSSTLTSPHAQKNLETVLRSMEIQDLF